MSHILSARNTVSLSGNREKAFSEKLDPRSCVLSALMLSGSAMVVSRLDLLAGMALFMGLAVVLLTRQPLATAMQRVMTVDGFIIFMLVMVPFQVPGQEAFSLFGIKASWPGVERAVQLALRANVALLAMQAFICGLEPARLGHAMHQLHCPRKLVALLLFTVRYLDLLKKRYHTVHEALKARGFHPQCNLHSWKTLAWVYCTLLLRSIDQSERMHQAMRCRGFDGRWHVLVNHRIQSVDILFMAVVAGICSLLIGWQFL